MLLLALRNHPVQLLVTRFLAVATNVAPELLAPAQRDYRHEAEREEDPLFARAHGVVVAPRTHHQDVLVAL